MSKTAKSIIFLSVIVAIILSIIAIRSSARMGDSEYRKLAEEQLANENSIIQAGNSKNVSICDSIVDVQNGGHQKNDCYKRIALSEDNPTVCTLMRGGLEGLNTSGDCLDEIYYYRALQLKDVFVCNFILNERQKGFCLEDLKDSSSLDVGRIVFNGNVPLKVGDFYTYSHFIDRLSGPAWYTTAYGRQIRLNLKYWSAPYTTEPDGEMIFEFSVTEFGNSGSANDYTVQTYGLDLGARPSEEFEKARLITLKYPTSGENLVWRHKNLVFEARVPRENPRGKEFQKSFYGLFTKTYPAETITEARFKRTL